jgi:hypothetical protein
MLSGVAGEPFFYSSGIAAEKRKRTRSSPFTDIRPWSRTPYFASADPSDAGHVPTAGNTSQPYANVASAPSTSAWENIMMSRESTCRCLICALERSLTEQLLERPRQERYQQFADSRSLLSAFPSASDLIAYLHTCRGSNGVDSTDRILAELLQTIATNGDAAALRDLLLLAFIPMLHATSRQVAARYLSLSTDDIAQHVVASLLQILGSPEFNGRSSHIAFAISRILKRNAFEWARRECLSPLHDAVETFSDPASSYDTPEPVERAALLQHFLHRCQQRGLLTREDLELLVQCKLDTARDREPGGPAAVVSNAARQRMKRLLGKLRRIARTPRNSTQNEVQLRLF